MSENEMGKLAKEINFDRLNIPKEGLAVGQLILIYKKWAGIIQKMFAGPEGFAS